MKVKTEEFREILRKVQPGLATKGIVEQATHFVFTGDDILTYNDAISISYPLETDFECSVPAEALYKLVSKLTEDEIELTMTDGQLHIVSGTTTAGINVSTDKTILDMVDTIGLPEDDDWKPLGPDFQEGLGLCIFSASNDITAPYLTCISVEQNRLVSGDDVRVSLFELENSIKDNFLLPALSAVELIKFDITEYALGKSWVYFCTEDDIIFCSRIVVDEYPDVEDWFNVKGPTMIIPSKFKESVDIVAPMSDGDFDIDKQIEVSVKNNELRCRSEGVVGWTQDTSQVKEKMPDIGFKVNPIFLLEVLGKETTMIYEEGKILLLSGKLKHLMALYS
jgi:DNA polymerase III sliding clamp (beta) subunit (PCNA family)